MTVVIDTSVTMAWCFEDVLGVGRRHGLSAHDASYLLLAERHAAPLATLDRTLATAAGAAGVEVLFGA